MNENSKPEKLNGTKKPKWLVYTGYAVLGVVALFTVGWVVMYLWNAVVAPAVGVKELTYWQGVGLLLLAKILFGGKHGHKKYHKPQMSKEEFMGLSEEERCRMREEWEKRCKR